MSGSYPLRPDDRVDANGARQRNGDEDVFRDGNLDRDEEDEHDEGGAFHCSIG